MKACSLDFFGAFRERLFTVRDEKAFQSLAMEAYAYQRAHNPLYARFVGLLGARVASAQRAVHVPFLPIACFANRIASGDWPSEKVFWSSGTTRSTPGGAARAPSQRNQHHIDTLAFYEQVVCRLFEGQYGHLSGVHLVFLLPYYAADSSLVHMAKCLQAQALSARFFSDWDHRMLACLEKLGARRGKKIILGLTHALLSLAEAHSPSLRDFVVVETGGMKKRRKTWLREEIHDFFLQKFDCQSVHSEYGMTELLSQSYTRGGDRFHTPPWVRVYIRPFDDAFSLAPPGALGRVDVVDLANIHSCCFIATEDVGRKHADGSFEILGRREEAPPRGCNFLL